MNCFGNFVDTSENSFIEQIDVDKIQIKKDNLKNF